MDTAFLAHIPMPFDPYTTKIGIEDFYNVFCDLFKFFIKVLMA